MQEARIHFGSENEIKEYIAECEGRFSFSLERACRNAVSTGSHILTLCGPTCSGKTTSAKRLCEEFDKQGKKLHVISIDDFYFSHEYLKLLSLRNGGAIDYDTPDTIDFACFSKVVDDIIKCDVVDVPRYDFTKGRRVSYEKMSCTEDDAFLFEGIQAVYPDLTNCLAPYSYSSLFISVEQPLLCGSVIFDPREIRFLRRLVRDYKFRAASAQFTFSLWDSVCENEDKNIYPNISNCKIKINSLLPYEINVIKPYVLEVLSKLPSGSEYEAQADKIIKKLSHIEAIDEKFVPKNSVFREFIG